MLIKAVSVAKATRLADTSVKELQSSTARASSVFPKEDKSIYKYTHAPKAQSKDNSIKSRNVIIVV